MEKQEFESELTKLSVDDSARKTIQQMLNWIKTVPELLNDLDFAFVLVHGALNYGANAIVDNYKILSGMNLTPQQLKNQLTRYINSLASVNLGEENDVYILYKSFPNYNKKLKKNIVNMTVFVNGQIYFPALFLSTSENDREVLEFNQIHSDTAYKLNIIIDAKQNLRFAKYLNMKPSTMPPPKEEEIEKALAGKFAKLDTRDSIENLTAGTKPVYTKGFMGEILQQGASKTIYQFFPDDVEVDGTDILPEVQYMIGVDNDFVINKHDRVMLVTSLMKSKQGDNGIMMFPNFMRVISKAPSVDSVQSSLSNSSNNGAESREESRY
jgi:hypothetical protein